VLKEVKKLISKVDFISLDKDQFLRNKSINQ